MGMLTYRGRPGHESPELLLDTCTRGTRCTDNVHAWILPDLQSRLCSTTHTNTHYIYVAPVAVLGQSWLGSATKHPSEGARMLEENHSYSTKQGTDGVFLGLFFR